MALFFIVSMRMGDGWIPCVFQWKSYEMSYRLDYFYFNEISLNLGKSIYHVISFIMVWITPFLVLFSSEKHKESIGAVSAKIW